jgi:hypothetical protein
MSTTKGYLHLAAVVFPDEADALERRLLGRAFYPSEPTSDDLSEPETAEQAGTEPDRPALSEAKLSRGD